MSSNLYDAVKIDPLDLAPVLEVLLGIDPGEVSGDLNEWLAGVSGAFFFPDYRRRKLGEFLLKCKRFTSRYMTSRYVAYAQKGAPGISVQGLARLLALATDQPDKEAEIRNYLGGILAAGLKEHDDVFRLIGGRPGAEGGRELRVIVVGGGPSGLAAAIQARLMGAAVTLYEKYPSYARDNAITLREQAMDQLKLLGVHDKIFGGASPKGRASFQPAVSIRWLEEALLERALQLGVTIVREKFDPRDIRVPYDLLIGADSKRSEVRAITSSPGVRSIHDRLSVVYATALFSPDSARGGTPGAKSLDYQGTKAGIFYIPLPNVSYLLMSVPNRILERALRDALVKIARAQQESGPLDVAAMREIMDKTFAERVSRYAAKAGSMSGYLKAAPTLKKVSQFDVELTQAIRFADQGKRVVIVGDAAATTNPFEGQGASTALFEAGVVGQLIDELAGPSRPGDPSAAWEKFDHRMHQITRTLMIETALRSATDYYGMPGQVYRDRDGNYYLSMGGKDPHGQPNLRLVPTPGRQGGLAELAQSETRLRRPPSIGPWRLTFARALSPAVRAPLRPTGGTAGVHSSLVPTSGTVAYTIRFEVRTTSGIEDFSITFEGGLTMRDLLARIRNMQEPLRSIAFRVLHEMMTSRSRTTVEGRADRRASGSSTSLLLK